MSTGNTRRTPSGDSPGRLLGWVGAGVIAAVLLLIYMAFGNRKDELATDYGKRRGAGAAESVNGTAVLAGMFEKAGHRVTSFKEMNRRLDQYDTIVWAPDSFDAPSTEARHFVETWLASQPKRTFIYIGRDYDAAPEYWQRMLRQVNDSRWEEYQRRWAQSQSTYDSRRTEMPVQEDAGWFVLKTDEPTRKIPDLDGPWAEGIDAGQTDIVLAGRLDIPEPSDEVDLSQPQPTWMESQRLETEVLLQSENDILAHRVSESWWNESKIIVVANGSFTLNLPLVNKEHRKLTAKLIAEAGEPGDVAFLESGPNGITVRQGDPPKSQTNALHLFTIWPISFIFVHFAALGIAYCMAVFPIFGRPRHLPSDARSDFGQHVAALGELLQRTKDTFFADSRIRAYQTHAKRGSGQAHRTPTTDSPTTITNPDGKGGESGIPLPDGRG